MIKILTCPILNVQESRPLGAILVSQFTVSAPDPTSQGDTGTDPIWLIRLLKDGSLAMTLGAESQAERDQWLSSLYNAATTPIKVRLDFYTYKICKLNFKQFILSLI